MQNFAHRALICQLPPSSMHFPGCFCLKMDFGQPKVGAQPVKNMFGSKGCEKKSDSVFPESENRENGRGALFGAGLFGALDRKVTNLEGGVSLS